MSEQEIFETQDGSHSIFSSRFGVSYHSRYGAVQESRHVFIESGLLYQALFQKELSVLEIGLGTGLNVLLTLLEAEERGLVINYEAVEAFPISVEQAGQLNYPFRLGVPEAREAFLRIHSAPWDRAIFLKEGFRFRKAKRRFEEVDYREEFDLIYFDAFAPDAQPELWDLPVLSRMYEALRPRGVLVTYCAKGVVKRRLQSLGFKVEALPGPPGKREMTRGTKE